MHAFGCFEFTTALSCRKSLKMDRESVWKNARVRPWKRCVNPVFNRDAVCSGSHQPGAPQEVQLLMQLTCHACTKLEVFGLSSDLLNSHFVFTNPLMAPQTSSRK